MGCFSFYANKIVTTGEGGMVVTNDDKLAERLRLLRNLAFGTPRFLHQVAGYNFRMTGYQAALGLPQVRRLESIVAEKRRIAQTYNKALEGVAGLRLPVELPWARNVYWMYAITVEPAFGKTRDQLMQYLAKHGIETRTFFCGMNQQPFLRAQPGYRDIPNPVADRLWTTGLYLPSAVNLQQASIEQISERIRLARTEA
jgi:perosamine synthetase